MNPITHLWLRQHGFRIETPVVCEPNMKIEIDRQSDTALELGPCGSWRGTGAPTEWHCWFRNDLAGRRARFIHLRMVQTTDQVAALYAALTGHTLAEDADFLAGGLERKAKFNTALREARREGRQHWQQHTRHNLDWMLRKS